MKKTLGIIAFGIFLMTIQGYGEYSSDFSADDMYFCWTQGADLYAIPNMDAQVIGKLRQGEDVYYLGKRTVKRFSTTLYGETIVAPLAYVRTTYGINGWVYAGNLEKKMWMRARYNQSLLRTVPNDDKNVVVYIRKGDRVMYLGETSGDIYPIEMRGTQYKLPWIKVKTEDGKIGWAFCGGFYNIPTRTKDMPQRYVAMKDSSKVLLVGKNQEYWDLRGAALDAKEGDVIKIVDRSVYGGVIVEGKKNLTITSDINSTIIFDGNGATLMFVNCDGIQLNNITIIRQNSQVAVNQSALFISDCGSVVVEGCSITSLGGTAITGYNSASIHLLRNYIADSAVSSVDIFSTSFVRFVENKVYNNGAVPYINGKFCTNTIDSGSLLFEYNDLKNNALSDKKW